MKLNDLETLLNNKRASAERIKFLEGEINALEWILEVV